MRERTKHRRTSAHFTIDIQNPGRYWAKAAVNDLLTRPADDFDRAAKFVLEKNRKLYRRLS
jgi:hypothetical protein